MISFYFNLYERQNTLLGIEFKKYFKVWNILKCHVKNENTFRNTVRDYAFKWNNFELTIVDKEMLLKTIYHFPQTLKY